MRLRENLRLLPVGILVFAIPLVKNFSTGQSWAYAIAWIFAALTVYAGALIYGQRVMWMVFAAGLLGVSARWIGLSVRDPLAIIHEANYIIAVYDLVVFAVVPAVFAFAGYYVNQLGLSVGPLIFLALASAPLCYVRAPGFNPNYFLVMAVIVALAGALGKLATGLRETRAIEAIGTAVAGVAVVCAALAVSSVWPGSSYSTIGVRGKIPVPSGKMEVKGIKPLRIEAMSQGFYLVGKVVNAEKKEDEQIAVGKYAGDSRLWGDVFGTDSLDDLADVAVDAKADSIYLIGSSWGRLFGHGNIADEGIEWSFIRAYGLTGAKLWTKQFNADLYEPSGIAVDSDSAVYLVGERGLFRKYDADGSLLWTRQINPRASGARAACGRPGHVYIGSVLPASRTGRRKALIEQYNGRGRLIFRDSFAGDESKDSRPMISANEQGELAVAGSLEDKNFLRLYDQKGLRRRLSWDAEDGTINGVLIDNASRVYVFGSSDGRGYVRKFENGKEVWTKKFDGSAVVSLADNAHTLYVLASVKDQAAVSEIDK
jgi:hypothetical protein